MDHDKPAEFRKLLFIYLKFFGLETEKSNLYEPESAARMATHITTCNANARHSIWG